ncbi:MAG: hypothetical protein RL026_1142 [Pseudomonadota bacterium]
MRRPEIYLTFQCPPELSALRDGAFVLHAHDADAKGVPPDLSRVRAVVTNGIKGADEALMARFPSLEIIASLGIGLDALDLAAARARGIIVTHTPGVVADDVADLAMAMIIDRLRRMREAQQFLLAGQWTQGPFPLARSVTGKRLGIIGLGAIGQGLARRAVAHGLQVRWTGPRDKPDLPYAFEPDLLQLAADSDVLAVCCAAGPATRHLVDARVLEALGPQGILVNVARGSIVETQALVTALTTGRLAAAALDVFESQPQVPVALQHCPNVLLTPHLGTATCETRAQMGRMVIESLQDHFAGRPLRHRVA